MVAKTIEVRASIKVFGSVSPIIDETVFWL